MASTLFQKQQSHCTRIRLWGVGEYTIDLAKAFSKQKISLALTSKDHECGRALKKHLENRLTNVAFLRTNIEVIDSFFASDEVAEIWLTFSDPQMKSKTKRLTSTFFLNRYRRMLLDNGLIHVKTDSNFLYTYTKTLLEENHLPIEADTNDLYHSDCLKKDDKILSIKNLLRTTVDSERHQYKIFKVQTT